MQTINHKQFDVLSGFYAHLYCVYHDGVKSDFGFYAEQLDSINVPWSIQNRVAVMAEDRGSQSKYFRTLLKEKDIHIEA
jgi:hypothetical protein